MKKKIILFSKILGIILFVIIISGVLITRSFSKTFLSFEDGFKEKKNFEELTINGYRFLDRNGNNKLDNYEDSRLSNKIRSADLLSQMTLEEKIHLLKGSGLASALGRSEPGESIPGAVGTIVPTPRLGIPTIYLSDGPAGLRIQPIREGDKNTYYCTAFPIATLLASSWNEKLVKNVGIAMGNEALEYGIDVILGPGANIHRHPLCGRNFEYYSEDPILSGFIGAAMVNGIESNGIGTAVKHFVANNQETERIFNDVIISERALREIYLKGFEIIVKKAQPWTIMSSYNKVNGTYVAESDYLLTDILRKDWSFEGLVMSDWFGGRNPVAMISAGNDLLEPGTLRQWTALKEAVEKGELTEEDIDRAVGRILNLIFKSGKFEEHFFNNNPNLKAHAIITRESASEGMVLLKNNKALPLKPGSNVALLGTTSYNFIAGGTGSGDVNEAYTISLEDGLSNAGFEINSEAKLAYELHKNSNLKAFKKPEGINAIFNPFIPPEIQYSKNQLNNIVSSSDVGVLTLGRNAGEGGDRVVDNDFLLSENEQEIISVLSESFYAAGKKLIVVLNIGGVIETASWKLSPDAILLAWQGGQEGGNSVADILSGKVNPSGKLPVTFPINLNDHLSHKNFPEGGNKWSLSSMMKGLMFPPNERPDKEKVKNRDYTNYEEDIYVGYRHFDKQSMKVSYPFGFGLSYTDFKFENMEVVTKNDTINIKMRIKNIGKIPGKEVVQIYTEKLNSVIDRPIQELKAFTKTVLLQPEAVDIISIQIPIKDLRYWDDKANGWNLEKGSYKIKVGASSRDIRQSKKIEL
jgi:beta-glucosidase